MTFPVLFVGAGPGDPDLLTLKALRAIESAEIIVHDRLVTPGILALAGPSTHLVDVGKKGFGPTTAQETINNLLVRYARSGRRVVRLKAGDPTVFGRLDEEIETLEHADIPFAIIPGLTAASAAMADLGQSFTRRGRNSAVRLITGHDVAGYADHDWRMLARPGEVAAIYMGGRAARFIQGRLLMHGAAPETPVSFVENASRLERRVIASTLAHMANDLTAAATAGPVLTVLGLAPRAAVSAHPILQEEFA